MPAKCSRVRNLENGYKIGDNRYSGKPVGEICLDMGEFLF